MWLVLPPVFSLLHPRAKGASFAWPVDASRVPLSIFVLLNPYDELHEKAVTAAWRPAEEAGRQQCYCFIPGASVQSRA
jgi:hypothetical protein